MTNLVNITNNQVTTNSRTVAEVFGRRHCDVLRAVKMLNCSPKFSARNFALAEYLDEQGKSRNSYNMTRDGWTFLVMGFTGAKAAEWKEKYIAAFNAMEQTLKSQAVGYGTVNFKQALYDYFGETVYNEEAMPKIRAVFQKWMKDAFSESLGQSIDAYIKAEMDERVKYFVEFVFKNYPGMSQEMKEYLIAYGIVNYGKYSEYTREKDFRGICETLWRHELKDPAKKYAKLKKTF